MNKRCAPLISLSSSEGDMLPLPFFGFSLDQNSPADLVPLVISRMGKIKLK